MIIELGKPKKEKPRGKYWFAWHPIIAIDRDGNRYIAFLEPVWKQMVGDTGKYLTYISWTEYYKRRKS
jgi:hypothetical protein